MFLAETTIQLVPDGTMLLHIVVIVVMVAVVNRTLLGPINRILAEREKQIKSAASEEKKLESERAGKFEQYNATLHDARSEGYRLLERERGQAIKLKDEQVRKAKQEITKTTTAQLDELHKQEDQVRRELETQAVTFSEIITARVLRTR
jgi:F-type H+-transporting ATPase subunit b